MPPVLLIIFNRPGKVARMVEALRAIKPNRIYVAADGPRTNVASDTDRCQATRAAINKIDWPCEVITRFQTDNLGCKRGVSSAITWFFTLEDRGIILEDDCIPSQEFFHYTADLLERYANDPQVMHINGTTFIKNVDDDSYYFSRIPLVWGWATWRRAWEQYDIEMNDIDVTAKAMRRRRAFKSRVQRAYWISLFYHVKDARIDTWDAQWVHTVMKADGICITPRVNLIQNIGFDQEATHTTTKVEHARDHEPITFPLRHPSQIRINDKNDTQTMETAFINSLKKRLLFEVKAILLRS